MRPSPPGVPSFLLLLIQARWPPGARPGRRWPHDDHLSCPRAVKATLDPLETLATPSFPPRSLYRSRCELARELAAATLDPAATVPRLPPTCPNGSPTSTTSTTPNGTSWEASTPPPSSSPSSDRRRLSPSIPDAPRLPEHTATSLRLPVSHRVSPLASPHGSITVAVAAIAARSSLRSGARHRRPRRCHAHPGSPPCSRPRQDPVEPPQ